MAQRTKASNERIDSPADAKSAPRARRADEAESYRPHCNFNYEGPQQDSPPLDVREIACALGVSHDVVRARIRKKQLLAGKVGGQWRVSPEDLADYVNI